jgi:ribonuclease HII
VGAVAYPRNFKPVISDNKIRIDDSKKLSKRQRNIAEKWIRGNGLGYATAEISARKIDRMGISKATASGFRRVVKTLQNHLGTGVDYLLIDAFYVPYTRGLPVNKKQTAIVHGDTKSFTIASASIVAKVYRDKLMTALGEQSKGKYRRYHWDQNKGYGTAGHRRAIKKYGITRYHRRTFLS